MLQQLNFYTKAITGETIAARMNSLRVFQLVKIRPAMSGTLSGFCSNCWNSQLRRRRNLDQIAELHTNAGERCEQRGETRQVAGRIWPHKPVPDDRANSTDLDAPTSVVGLHRLHDLTV